MTTPSPATSAAASPTERRTPSATTAFVAIGVITVAGAILRLWGLGHQSFWYDEWLTAKAADGSAGHLYRYVTTEAGIPPTFFVLEWLWAAVAGTSEFALRLPSAVAGIALIPVVAAAARAWKLPRSAWVAAALLAATNPFLVWYSQEARPYAFVALGTAVTLWALPRWISTGARRDLGIWALAAAATVAFHYYAIFLIALEAAYLLWSRRPARRDVVSLLPATIVSLALLPFAVAQISRRGNHDWIGTWSLGFRLDELADSALAGPGSTPTLLLQVVGAIAVFAGIAAAFRRRPATSAAAAPTEEPSDEPTDEPSEEPGGRRLQPAVLAVFGLGAVLLAWFVAIAGVDGFLSRYLIGSVVALAVLLPASLGDRRTRPIGAAALAVLVAFGTVEVVQVQRDEQRQRSSFEALAAAHHRGGSDPASRVLVFDWGPNQFLPATWYDGDVVTEDRAVTVTEIDLVRGTPADEDCNWFVGRTCGGGYLDASLPPALADAFTPVATIPAGTFEIVRYRSDAPQVIRPSDFDRHDDLAPIVLD